MFHTKKWFLSAALLCALPLAQTFADHSCIVDAQNKGGFLPENKLNIPVGAKGANTMTKEKFNQIIDLANQHYAPIVRSKRGTLRWARKWDDGTVNASAQRLFTFWQVNMYGGLARHPLVTEDGFALVVCHELGHHLGGAPKVANAAMKWASNEGQSDYFATLKCFRRMYEGDDNATIVSQMQVDPTVAQKCDDQFSHPNDVALCVRAAMGGKSLASLLGSLGGDGNVDFNTPDTRRVTTTDDTHPAAQCRLDTYFQGSLCEMGIKDELSDTNAQAGTCTLARGQTIGTRPLCWYKP